MEPLIYINFELGLIKKNEKFSVDGEDNSADSLLLLILAINIIFQD